MQSSLSAISMNHPQSSPYLTTTYNTGGHQMHHSMYDGSVYKDGGIEQERRHIQSVILNEEYLSQQAEDTVTYVEVPYIEEVIRHVPRREIVEIEKRVPKYEIEYVDRIVEIPQIQYIDKTIEIPQVHEVLRHVPKREVVEIPREFIKHVPRIETKIVEKVVEVPGEKIEVPKPYVVENKVPVAQYVDTEVPMVVAQTVRPVISEMQEQYEVDVMDYEPEVIQVTIHVPKALPTRLVAKGVTDEIHRVVDVPAAQYNSMLRFLNPHISERDASALPFISQNGKVHFLGSGEPIPQVSPLRNAEIIGWNSAAQQHRHSGPGVMLNTDHGKNSLMTDNGLIREVASYSHRSTGKLHRGGHRRKARGVCPC